MKKLFSFFWSALFILSTTAGPLFENGKTQWRIVLPDNPGTMKYAASELAATLKKISGADFTVQKSAAKEFALF